MRSFATTLRCDFSCLFKWLELIMLCSTKALWTIKEIFGDVWLSRLPCDYFCSLNLSLKWTKQQQKAYESSINSVFWFRLRNFCFLQRYYCSWMFYFRGVQFQIFLPIYPIWFFGNRVSLFQPKEFELKAYKIHCCTKLKSTCVLTKVSIIKHSNRWICSKVNPFSLS